MPRVNFKKEGLFDPRQPLFPDMVAGNYEEWTVFNRTFYDHPFHIHQNPVLITKINGITLPQPEWHDTLDVPGAVCPPDNTNLPAGPPVNINDSLRRDRLPFGRISIRSQWAALSRIAIPSTMRISA